MHAADAFKTNTSKQINVQHTIQYE